MCHKCIAYPFMCISPSQKCCPYQSTTLISYSLREFGTTFGSLSSSNWRSSDSNTSASQGWIVPLKSQPSCIGMKGSFQLQRYWEPYGYSRSSGHPPTPETHSLPNPHRQPVENPAITYLGAGAARAPPAVKAKACSKEAREGRVLGWVLP